MLLSPRPASPCLQVLRAQTVSCQVMAAWACINLLVVQFVMEGHAKLLREDGEEAPWEPTNPAHQALYW